MKTSVISVHDMLSVLSVAGVEKRIGAVTGVESVTVNFAAGNATVRYDETRLQAADIKAAVHQSGDEPGGESQPKPPSEHKPAVSSPEAAQASASTLDASAPKVSVAAPAVGGHQDHAAPEVKPSAPATAAPRVAAVVPPPAAHAVEAASGAKPSTPLAAAPNEAPVAPPASPAMEGQQGHAASDVKPSTPVAAAPKAIPVASTSANRAEEAVPVAKSPTPATAESKAGSWKVNALSLATTLGLAYISCAIFDLLFPPFGLLAALAPASPLPISGSPLGFLLGFAMFTIAGLVLGALHGFATQFWSNRFH